MAIRLPDLARWLTEPEGECLEFKEAKNRYDFEKLVEYCAAVANEGGGKIVLGVTDRRPRTVVGTSAFAEPGRTVAGLTERLRLRIDWAELAHPDGRVLVFDIPARPVGMPIQYKGIYWARHGDELGPMRTEELRRAFDEGSPDYSAEIVSGAKFSDLDVGAIERFRQMWRMKSGNAAIESLPATQLLEDAELLLDGEVTVAGLVLLGTKAALGRHLSQAELVFEYRANDTLISHQQRVEFREGFIRFLDELWQLVNLRNEVVQYQDGLFRRDIPVFNEVAVREAILNAVTHRDYRPAGSIFVRQFPRKLEITSPGGLPPGVTIENILWRQAPRNRRIAEACARCGLVERSGQGANRMYEESIREGKHQPDFAGTDEYQVTLTLFGDVRNPQFLRFLEKVGAERSVSFSIQDLLVLDALQREQPIPTHAKSALAGLHEQGIIERIGRGRGAKFILSRKFYSFLGKGGQYTRKRGLDRETQKTLLLRHIEGSAPEGARLKDLQEVLRELSRAQLQSLLRELKGEGRIVVTGQTNAGRWFLAPRDEAL